jgi:hypothetical protein
MTQTHQTREKASNSLRGKRIRAGIPRRCGNTLIRRITVAGTALISGRNPRRERPTTGQIFSGVKYAFWKDFGLLKQTN